MNRSQADINKNVDMIAARRREREYFAGTPEYKHLAHRMGSEHLAKMLSKVRYDHSICFYSLKKKKISVIILPQYSKITVIFFSIWKMLSSPKFQAFSPSLARQFLNSNLN